MIMSLLSLYLPRPAAAHPEHLGQGLAGLGGPGEVAPVERPPVPRQRAKPLGELELQDRPGEVPGDAKEGC